MALTGTATLESLVSSSGTIGSIPVGCSDAAPCTANRMRSVHIGSFSIDKTLVTVSEHRACVDDGACPALDEWNAAGWLSTDPREIVGVAPRLAGAFCIGWQAPAAEWALATRGHSWDHNKLIAPRSYRRSEQFDVFIEYRAAGTRSDVQSYFGVEDTTGTGPEYVSDDGKQVKLRGCANQMHRGEQEEECQLVRVEEPPLDVYSAFRCVYSR